MGPNTRGHFENAMLETLNDQQQKHNHQTDDIDDDDDDDTMMNSNGNKNNTNTTNNEQEEDIDSYKSGNADPDFLYENLCEQPWHNIGEGDGILSSTNNFHLMVDQISSVLCSRLKDMVLARPNDPSKLMQRILFLDKDSGYTELSPNVIKALHLYVTKIGKYYLNHDANYHNFEHATHVTLSVNKLLCMLLKEDDFSHEDNENSNKNARPGLNRQSSNSSSVAGSNGDNNNNEDDDIITPPPPPLNRGSTTPTDFAPKPFNKVQQQQQQQTDDNSNNNSNSAPAATTKAAALTKAGSTTSVIPTQTTRRASGKPCRASLAHIGHIPGKRISISSVTSTGSSNENDNDGKCVNLAKEATFGIATDPTIRFALVFAALIHDADHQGVPNASLVDEEDDIAIIHNDVSVAEQHSLHIAFLMLRKDPDFALLKRCIMPDKDARKKFRKAVIDIVFATDISNPERMQLSKSKWEEAFPQQQMKDDDKEDKKKEAEKDDNGSSIKLKSRKSIARKSLLVIEKDDEKDKDGNSSNDGSEGDDEFNTSFSDLKIDTSNKDKDFFRKTTSAITVSDKDKRTMELLKEKRGSRPEMSKRHSMYQLNSVQSRKLQQKNTILFSIRKSIDFGGKVIDTYEASKDGDLQLRQHTVLCTLMNVADVAHTMQSFNVFVKWNKRLYKELLVASREGRIAWDPTDGWYYNQIGFYDAYIIPLAEKLKKCGVFGSKSTVFLYFAIENKKRWEKDGMIITEKIINDTIRELDEE